MNGVCRARVWICVGSKQSQVRLKVRIREQGLLANRQDRATGKSQADHHLVQQLLKRLVDGFVGLGAGLNEEAPVG